MIERSGHPERDARRVLVWMCVLIAVNQLGFGAVIPVLPLYAQSFDVSQAAIGATVAIYGLARVLCSVPTGRVADRFGRRSALAIGGVVSTLGNLWCAVAGSYTELVLARFVAGAGAGHRDDRRDDRARGHHADRDPGPRHGHLPGRLPVRGRYWAVPRRLPGGTLRAGRAVPPVRSRERGRDGRRLVRRGGDTGTRFRPRRRTRRPRQPARPAPDARGQHRVPPRVPHQPGERGGADGGAVQHRPHPRPGTALPVGHPDRPRLRARQHRGGSS